MNQPRATRFAKSNYLRTVRVTKMLNSLKLGIILVSKGSFKLRFIRNWRKCTRKNEPEENKVINVFPRKLTHRKMNL